MAMAKKIYPLLVTFLFVVLSSCQEDAPSFYETYFSLQDFSEHDGVSIAIEQLEGETSLNYQYVELRIDREDDTSYIYESTYVLSYFNEPPIETETYYYYKENMCYVVDIDDTYSEAMSFDAFTKQLKWPLDTSDFTANAIIVDNTMTYLTISDDHHTTLSYNNQGILKEIIVTKQQPLTTIITTITFYEGVGDVFIPDIT